MLQVISETPLDTLGLHLTGIHNVGLQIFS